MEKKYVIGIDYGTDSGRAVLLDALTGEPLAAHTVPYPRWARGLYCDPARDRFRQHPKDYLEVLETILGKVIAACPDPGSIVAIGIDTTASTPCLVDRSLTPLSLTPGFEENPDAMFILWKDHTGMEESREINELCASRGYPYTAHCGNNYSAENFWSKILHVTRTAPEVAGAAFSAIECCDYLAAVLTGCHDLGTLRPGHCCLGAKWMWAEEWGGYPPGTFFEELDPRLTRLQLPEKNYGCDVAAGTLCPEWAAKLGLPESVIIGVGNVDSYSGAVGGGVRYRTLVMNLGTSACFMAVMPKATFGDRIIDGVFAQVDGSILPGQVGIESGLTAFGDIYAWVRNLLSWPLRQAAAADPSFAGKAEAMEDQLIADLSAAAAALPVQEDAPLATDYLNGRRSPFGDNSLTGTVTGLKLGTSAPEFFRAFVEASAFAIRAVVDHMEAGGVEIGRCVAVGGVAQKSPFVMQMLADVLGKPIEVSSSKDSCALGAAIHAAVAAGLYPTVEAAEEALCPPAAKVYVPATGQEGEEPLRSICPYRVAKQRGEGVPPLPTPKRTDRSVLEKRYRKYLRMTGLEGKIPSLRSE